MLQSMCNDLEGSTWCCRNYYPCKTTRLNYSTSFCKDNNDVNCSSITLLKVLYKKVISNAVKVTESLKCFCGRRCYLPKLKIRYLLNITEFFDFKSKKSIRDSIVSLLSTIFFQFLVECILGHLWNCSLLARDSYDVMDNHGTKSLALLKPL